MASTSSTSWKMGFAPHIGLTSLDTPLFKESVGSIDPVDQINYIADLGFAGIEDNLLKLRTVADQERIGQALARRGLEMGCFVNNAEHWNAPLWGRTDEDARSQITEDLQQSIEAARRVGGKYLTTITGRDLDQPHTIPLQAMIENLKRSAEVADKAGVVLGIEATNERGFPGMLVHHILDAYAVVKAVNSPAVKLVFDAFHVQVMDGDIIRNFDRTYDAIGIIQLADNPDRLELGTGEINFANFLRHVVGKGFNGLVELEHAISNPGKQGEQDALVMLQSINDAI